jgi:hypothetical protein
MLRRSLPEVPVLLDAKPAGAGGMLVEYHKALRTMLAYENQLRRGLLFLERLVHLLNWTHPRKARVASALPYNMPCVVT